jgi:transposase
MRKLEISDKDIMQVAIQEEIARSEESRYDHRLHGVLLLSHGLSCHQVAEYLGQDAVTVQRWVHRFNERGFAGLAEGSRSGRPCRIPPKIWSRLERDLRKPPSAFSYGQNLWDGKILGHHLSECYGIDLAVRQCQRLFRRMGFRRRKPRPAIAGADPVAQKEYQKTAPSGPRRKRRPVESG